MFGATAPIESQNVVGYAQSTLRKNATMITPQFTGVDGAEISLDSLVPTGANTSDNVNIRILDEYGRTIDGKEYTWNDWVGNKACWVNGDLEEVSGITFEPGQGLWVYGATTAQTLQSSGQVAKEDCVVQLRKNATATGNPFPAAVDLQDILAEGENCSDNVNIRVLDEYGSTVEGMDYTWNDWVGDKACWVNGDLEEVLDVSFKPGQGLWVYGSSDKQYLCFPAPQM